MGLKSIFKRRKPRNAARLELTGYQPTFTAWNGNAYENDIYRAGVDAIARNAAKMILQPVKTFNDGSTAKADEGLTHLLQVEPNPLITAYDLLYKMVTQLYTLNNSFTYIHRIRGKVIGLYPLTVSSCSFELDETGHIWVKVVFPNGQTYALPYEDVIHLRRHFNGSDVLGDSNGAIAAGLEIAHTQNEGIVQSIKAGGSLRGILRFSQIMNRELMAQSRDQFVNDYLGVDNSGGIAVTDQSMTFTPTESKPVTISAEEQAQAKTKIYNYLGITEAIVNASYTDDQWSAFNESVIEPLALQITLEATRKLLTPDQVRAGYQVQCSTGRLQFISNENKVKLIKETMPMGILTVNQALEILGLPPVEGGEIRLQSLNYIDQSKADQYQLARADAGTLRTYDDERN